MKDILFFPLAILVAAGMVAGAMMMGGDAPQCGPVGGANGPADYSSATVNGADLCRLEGRRGFGLNLSDDGILTLSVEPQPPRDDPEQNPNFKLAADLELVYAGQKLRVSVTAKPAGAGGAEAFEVMYSTGKGGNSGWRRFDMKPDWDTYRFEYNVPEKLLEDQDAAAFDYLAIRPVGAEKTRVMEIREVDFRRYGKWAE